MKSRLSRLDQVFLEHPVYFVTAFTFERRKLLDNQSTHDCLARFFEAAKARGVLAGRYVIMPDHLHLFVCITTGALGLSDWMKSLKNAVSKSLRSGGVPSPHWQKGFFDHLLRSDESHAEKWSYVRDNPVRAGLCAKAEAWPYAGEIHRL